MYLKSILLQWSIKFKIIIHYVLLDMAFKFYLFHTLVLVPKDKEKNTILKSVL